LFQNATVIEPKAAHYKAGNAIQGYDDFYNMIYVATLHYKFYYENTSGSAGIPACNIVLQKA
jgi:hypothetical protein